VEQRKGLLGLVGEDKREPQAMNRAGVDDITQGKVYLVGASRQNAQRFGGPGERSKRTWKILDTDFTA
jgi:hypothetical protein